MQPIMIPLLLLILVAASNGELKPTMGASTTTSDYVHPQYALRYVALGDYKQANLNGVNSQGTYTTPDQQGYIRYITYTTDGTNIYQTIIRLKPGTYPVAWSTPVNSRLVSATQSTEEKTDGELQNKSQVNVKESEASHPSEDTAPPTTTTVAQETLPETTYGISELSAEDIGATTTLSSVEELKHDSDSIRFEDDEELQPMGEETGNALSEGNDYVAQGSKMTPQYFASPYGTIALYPMTYNPYAIQRRPSVSPTVSTVNAQLTSPTMAALGETNPTIASIQTTVPTTRPLGSAMEVPTMRPSSVPIGITTSSSPVRVSYVYPYMRYQTQNPGVVYQVPQQIKTSPQYIGWSGASQPSYQATYPQGYMSYQPAVLALRSISPSNQSVEPKISVEPTMNTVPNTEQ